MNAEPALLFPPEVPQRLARAEMLRRKGEPDEAFREISLHLNENLDDYLALIMASHIMIEANRYGMAYQFLKRAAQLRPEDPAVWNNLGLCFQEGTNLEQGETYFYRSLKLAPEDANTHSNLGQLLLNMGEHSKALHHLNIAIENDVSNTDAYYSRSLINIARGNWEEGWPEYDACLGNPKVRPERVYGMIPKWNGKEGKTIIAYGEQGIGDEIAFSACIPDLMKNNKVIIDCDMRLYGLFKRSFGLETHGTRKTPLVHWMKEKNGMQRKIDAGVAFGSLPQFYRKKPEDCPGTTYLFADPERRIQWKALLESLGPKMKVGIAWTGGNQNTGRARRSLDIDDLLPILRQDATFISLQYMDCPEIYQLERDHGIKVHHWKHAVQTDDHDNTAALVSELDLVISVQTAVVHLCGALGQECWAMLPKTPRWFYGISGTEMPWYKSVRLYRQKHQWVHTVSDVATDLRNRINGNHNVR